jgi:SAM-dependent MidA family methyltransferase
MRLTDLERDVNAALQDIISTEIEARGSISFADYMRLALYHPVHGYYVTCDPTQDYQSSPNVHPVFGAMIARQLDDFWRLLGSPRRFDVFEAGSGSGRLAADVLRALSVESPEVYKATQYVLQDVGYGEDVSRVIELAGLPRDKVTVATELPAEPTIEGCILSNELLDALPFHRVRKRDGRLYELCVGLEDGRFVDVEAEPGADVAAHFEALGMEPGEGCDAEVCLEAPRWLSRAATALRRGYILTLDYGYPAESLYAPGRKRGTLLTFYRHTSRDDPYARPGRQDITASLDFTTLTRTGEAAGLRTHGLFSQTDFLANLGIGQTLGQRPPADALEGFYALRRSVIELTDSSGLGRISVLIQGKRTPDTAPLGLSASSSGS